MNLRRLYEHLDRDSRRILADAADRAAREGRRSITIEYFLLSLLRDRTTGPAVMAALDKAGADVGAIESALSQSVVVELRSTPGVLPSFDESLAHLLREAWALSFDEYGDVSVSPVRFFETVGRRGDAWPRLVEMLPSLDRVDLGTLASAVNAAGDRAEQPATCAAPTDERFPELSRFGYDIVAAAREGRFDPVVGFDDELQAISSILLRRRQNSVAVVGEAGVGKSACALGFVDAVAHASDRVGAALHTTPIWALDLSLLRAGAVLRGALEERLQAIVKEVEQAGMILFMDDLHLLFGDQDAGGDALRSILSGGAVRILGTCGWREWRRRIEPDPGLARRIAPVRIQEPDDAQTIAIIEGIAPVLAGHHDVRFADDVLASAVSLSRRYIVGRQLPDKAIVVLDSACARARMNGSSEPDGEAPVEQSDVASVVSDLTGVPIGGMLSDMSSMANRLENVLAERVVGQDAALERCASQARSYLAGLSDRRRPVGALMFCGPSGVGKTETAHAIADALFGGRILTINMSEYQEAHTVSGLKGAPAGYVGYGEGGVLTEGIRRAPFCVVLLDEVEKAHPDVIEMLYQVLDRGWMEDAEGIEPRAVSNAWELVPGHVSGPHDVRAKGRFGGVLFCDAPAGSAPFRLERDGSLTVVIDDNGCRLEGGKRRRSWVRAFRRRKKSTFPSRWVRRPMAIVRCTYRWCALTTRPSSPISPASPVPPGSVPGGGRSVGITRIRRSRIGSWCPAAPTGPSGSRSTVVSTECCSAGRRPTCPLRCRGVEGSRSR